MNTAAVNFQIVAHRFVNCILHNSFTFYVLAYKSIPHIPPPKKNKSDDDGSSKVVDAGDVDSLPSLTPKAISLKNGLGFFRSSVLKSSVIVDVRLQDVEDHRAKDTEEECSSHRAAGEEATRVMKAIKVGGGPFAFHCTGKPGSLST